MYLHSRPSIQEALFSFKPQINSLQEWLLIFEFPFFFSFSVLYLRFILVDLINHNFSVFLFLKFLIFLTLRQLNRNRFQVVKRVDMIEECSFLPLLSYSSMWSFLINSGNKTIHSLTSGNCNAFSRILSCNSTTVNLHFSRYFINRYEIDIYFGFRLNLLYE